MSRVVLGCLLVVGCGGRLPASAELPDAAPMAATGGDEPMSDASAPSTPHDGGASNDAAPAPPPSEPSFDSLPWVDVGTGVATKDSRNPRGENVFVGYAGYGVDDAQARAWLTALYDATLRARGVRYVYAVRGPADVEYTGKEIGNTHLIANLLPRLSASTHFIAVAGHSSGGWVACELLQQLYEGGLDPKGLTSGRTVYFDLDGVESCVDTTMAQHLRRVYFASAHTNAGGGGDSLNAAYMTQGAQRLAGSRRYIYDASNSGCQPTAALCLHVSLINTRPQDPSTGTPSDYASFAGRPVNHAYLDANAADLPE